MLPTSITGQEMALRLRNLIRMAAPTAAAAEPASGAEVRHPTPHVLKRLLALCNENTGKHTERMALSGEAWDAMRRHTTIGYELLRDQASPVLQLDAEIALSHYERWNGTGYPMGLRAAAEPIF